MIKMAIKYSKWGGARFYKNLKSTKLLKYFKLETTITLSISNLKYGLNKKIISKIPSTWIVY